MHENPCKGLWNLAKSPSEYLHSSALFYDTGKHSIYEVINYKELEDSIWLKDKRSVLANTQKPGRRDTA